MQGSNIDSIENEKCRICFRHGKRGLSNPNPMIKDNLSQTDSDRDRDSRIIFDN